MTIEITNTGGVVNIRDTSTPLVADQLDFTAAVNSFSLIVDRTNDVVQIRHSPTNRILCAEVLANFATPSAGDIDLLVVAIEALLFDSTPLALAGTLDFGMLYVSPSGSDTNPGSISKPLASFAQAASIAMSLEDSTKTTWCIHVLSGTYDEPIFGDGTTNPVHYHLHCGAVVSVTTVSAAVADTNGPVSITMEAGSAVESSAGNAVTSTDSPITIHGPGTIRSSTTGLTAIEAAGATAHVEIVGAYIQNGDGIDSALVTISGGTAMLRQCRIDSDAPSTPIMKSGGQLLLSGCEIVCAATNYADSAGLEDIQVIGSISNAASSVNIVEVGSPMVVLPSLI